MVSYRTLHPEGVENSATAAMLTGYGCDIAQGHHYSQPLTAPQILHLLAQITDATERRERNALMDCGQARREAAAVAPGHFRRWPGRGRR